MDTRKADLAILSAHFDIFSAHLDAVAKEAAEFKKKLEDLQKSE